MKTRTLLPLTGVIALSAMPQPVAAQGGMLEEVIVTARKREESLQETPVAVSAMNADAMREANIRNLGDLTQVVPGLSTRNGDKYAAFSIRGVGSRGGKSVREDPAVGVYVDGIFLPRSDSQLVDVVAVESVQVLRGPQGTLFGKNTAGGAILMTTVKPYDEFGGEVATEIGNLDRLNLSGRLNVPLTDNLFAAFTVNSRTRDGYMDDVATDIDYGDEDKIAYAAQLRWLASDNVTADFMAFYSEQDENAAPQTCIIANDPVNNPTPLQGFTAPGDLRLLPEACADSTALEDDEKVEMDRKGVIWEMESTMLGMNWAWEIGNGTFKSITGYLHQEDIGNWRDQDATSIFSITNVQLVVDQLNANGFDADEERDFYSQEFQWVSTAFDDRLDYTIGAFGSYEEIENNPNGNMLSDAGFLGIPAGANVATLPVTTAGFRVSNLADFENTTWAVFAQGTWHFNEQWNLTVGGRYGVEDKELDQSNFESLEPNQGVLSRAEFDALQGTIHELAPLSTVPQVGGSDDWDEFTPMVTLSYIGSDELLENWGVDAFMVYGTYSEGFKAGAFSVLDDDFLSIEPENVTNYEVGLKLDALDNRLRLNAALYYMEYDDMQITVTRQINDVNVAATLANAGESNMAGAELELSYLPTENWLLSVNASYVDAEYDEFCDIRRINPGNTPGQTCAIDPPAGFEPFDRSHEDFAYLPELTWSAFVQYGFANDWGEWTGRVTGIYKDEVFIGLEAGADASPASILDDYTLYNARLTWRSVGERDIEVALYCDNFTDEDYFGTGNLQLSAQGSLTVVAGIERTYGVQAIYRF